MKKYDEILRNIKNVILAKEPDAKVYLFGSSARGEANIESDWDLLILLNRDNILYDEEKILTDALFDFEIEVGEVISPAIYSLNEWNTKYKVTSFYKNIVKDGILL